MSLRTNSSARNSRMKVLARALFPRSWTPSTPLPPFPHSVCVTLWGPVVTASCSTSETIKTSCLCYRCCCYFRTASALTPSTQTEQRCDPFSFPSNRRYHSLLNQVELLPDPDNHSLPFKDDLDVYIGLCFFFFFLTPCTVFYPFSICIYF